MKCKTQYFISASFLFLSLVGCGNTLVDFNTPKSEELSAQYDFYSDSIRTIHAEMGITPEQSDEVFTILTSCGLDDKITYIFEDKGTYKVWWGLNSLDVTLDNGVVSSVVNGKETLYPEQKKSNILLDCQVKTKDVKSGSGEVIGECAYISVLKSELENITEDNYREFANSIVKDSGYNYFTIKCDDGTGIVFHGSNIEFASYGKLDKDMIVTEVYGTISLKSDGTCTYETESE